MAYLVLINGAPGSGKSTVATLAAASDPVGFALDLDAIKHALPQWDTDPTAAGDRARELWLAQAELHLVSGCNVYLGQYLAKPDFIERLEKLAGRTQSRLVEFILLLDCEHLAQRLARRIEHPDRPEHEVNSRLVSVVDVPELVRSIEAIRQRRPTAIVVDASGEAAETVAAVRRQIRLT